MSEFVTVCDGNMNFRTSTERPGAVQIQAFVCYSAQILLAYVGHLESKERLRIQPAQLFNFS